MMRRKLAAGNWKMNGTAADLAELEALSRTYPSPSVDVLICPPATLIHRAAQTVGDAAIMIGGQDCHTALSGAHTGDISAQMLMDAGASMVRPCIGPVLRKYPATGIHRELEG